jgi:hypothetical protein
MNTERKILANLAWRVYKARHKRNSFTKLYFGTMKHNLYWGAFSEWLGLHRALQATKQIYFDNQPQD